MDRDLDLHRYALVLVKRWRMIVAVAVVPALAVWVVSFIWPPTYQAVAMVVATRPSYQMAFDPKIESVVDLQVPSKAYSAIARNDQLREQIIAALGDTLPSKQRSIEELEKLCSVSHAIDASVIELKVRHRDPEVAAKVANTWATLFALQINALYGESVDDVKQLEEQLKVTGEKLEAAEEALVKFQKTYPAIELEETIKAQTDALAEYNRGDTDIQLALQDARSLHRQLQSSETASATLASELSALLTELGALGARRNVATQIQIPLDASAASGVSVAAQLQHLDNLIKALGEKRQALATARKEIPAKIREAQGELQQATTDLDRLVRARDIARETYQTLSRKVAEVSISTQLDAGEMQVVSKATVPLKPVSPKKALNTAVAGMLGLMVGGLVAFWSESYKAAEALGREG